jgi:hypothetical protein
MDGNGVPCAKPMDFALSVFATSIVFGPPIELKLRVPNAIGLIRTADTTRYSNVILESA